MMWKIVNSIQYFKNNISKFMLYNLERLKSKQSVRAKIWNEKEKQRKKRKEKRREGEYMDMDIWEPGIERT